MMKYKLVLGAYSFDQQTLYRVLRVTYNYNRAAHASIIFRQRGKKRDCTKKKKKELPLAPLLAR